MFQTQKATGRSAEFIHTSSDDSDCKSLTLKCIKFITDSPQTAWSVILAGRYLPDHLKVSTCFRGRTTDKTEGLLTA